MRNFINEILSFSDRCDEWRKLDFRKFLHHCDEWKKHTKSPLWRELKNSQKNVSKKFHPERLIQFWKIKNTSLAFDVVNLRCRNHQKNKILLSLSNAILTIFEIQKCHSQNVWETWNFTFFVEKSLYKHAKFFEKVTLF